MIKNITGGGKYLTVTGNPGSTYVNNYSGAQGVGNMRYNISNQNIEIYDGANWIAMQSGYATVSMNSEGESLLDWVRMKRNEEYERETLAKDNPAVRDILNQIKEKEDQLKMITTLLKSPGGESEQKRVPIGP
jgi:hypothetical protein